MTITTSVEVAIAELDAVVDRADSGTTNPSARFTIYAGAMPANARAPLGDATALVTIAMGNPAFGDAADNAAASAAEALANAIADTPALATGTASFYRLVDRDETVLWQGTVTEPNQGGDMEVSAINVVTGVNIVVQSFAMRAPY